MGIFSRNWLCFNTKKILNMNAVKSNNLNNLFPIFLKGNELNFLIIGGGEVALEKLTAVLNNSPEAKIRLVAKTFSESLLLFITDKKNIEKIEGEFEVKYLQGSQVVITALNNIQTSSDIKELANQKGILYNAADKPDLCDFYLGSIVQKGNLKIGISTNGKSPTLAKRIKEVLNETIPEEINTSLDQLQEIRNNLKGNFQEKVAKLNEITKNFEVEKKKEWFHFSFKRLFAYVFSILGIMLAGHLIFSIIPLSTIWNSASSAFDSLDVQFVYFMLGGFIAQMIDGALGMAYGVSATTFLLSFGVSPAIASMSVHTSEIFTSGVSGFMHLRFGNVNNKLFKTIVIPGVIGSILGAYVLTEFENYNSYIKPIVGIYTLTLGIIIIYKIIRKNNTRKKVKRAGWLASLGGFLDAIGGGGWGPVVSSTLIARGKNPRIVIGSVNLAEFFVSLASSFTFFTLLGASHWQPTLGLILGGVCAAPIAAHLSKKINIKAMMLMVGIIVIIVSLRIIIMSII